VYPTPPNHYPPLQPFYPSSFPDYPSSAYTSDNNGTIQSVDPTQIYSINPR
jgi:hypothetical protein